MKLVNNFFTKLILLIIQILIHFSKINFTSSTEFSTSTLTSVKTNTLSKAKSKTNTESENKFAEKINISQRFLKSKAKKLNISNKNLMKKTNSLLSSKNKFQTESKFSDKKILMKGWIKYFKISLNSEAKKNFKEKKNKNFIINFQYGEQFKLFDNIQMDLREPDGNFRYIRNKYNFWAILLNDSLNIISSRDVRKLK